jgi:hypothetical protein
MRIETMRLEILEAVERHGLSLARFGIARLLDTLYPRTPNHSWFDKPVLSFVEGLTTNGFPSDRSP